METIQKTMKINSLLFESNDSEVLVNGTIFQGHMSFNTDIVITHSQLNQLVNELQKQNEFIDMDTILTSEKMYNGETLYSASFASITNNLVDLNSIKLNQPIRQIRA